MSNLPLLLALSPSYYRPDFGWRMHPQTIREPWICVPKTDSISNIGKDGFQVCMDVQQFKPSELSVKVVENSIIVEGKHEERADEHGYISRHFVRRYVLPKDYDPEMLISTLSTDGVLTVSIPKPLNMENKPKERIIQIQQTGPAHLNVKHNENENPDETDPHDGASGDK